jgi:GNAT superfamily N-acetyltransferase
VPKRFQVRRLTSDLIDDAAALLAQRHRHARIRLPALDPAYESSVATEPLIAAALALDGAAGAIAYTDGAPAGFVLMTPRDDSWGANSWVEDIGCAGDAEAIRECYAAIAGDLVERGIDLHFAMAPALEDEIVDAWFSMSFGLQQVYAFREPMGTEFRPSIPDGLTIRRAEATDTHALAELDVVLPNHVARSPVFSRRPIPTVEEAEAELVDDVNNPKYTIWVAERDGRVVSELVGVDVNVSSSWTALMKPTSAALLGYGATLPEARGLGAGRALTETFFAWARDEGYNWLVTDWRSTNLEANRTWRAMGFRPFWLRLHRAIA